MYYNMRCKTIWRQFTEMEGKLKDLLQTILKNPNNRIRTLVLAVKEVSSNVNERSFTEMLSVFLSLQLEREMRRIEQDLGRTDHSDSDKEERVTT